MLDVLAWNARANHPSQARRVTTHLTGWLDAQVQVIVLTEVKGCRAALKSWGKRHGYRLFQERAIIARASEHGDTAVLLRVKGTHAVKPRRTWVAVMARPWWVFRYRVLHQPRRHLRVALDLPDGARVRFSGEHWPTRGNRDAWDESYHSARRFLRRRGRALVVGDLNSTYDEASRLADEVGGVVRGQRPDYLVTNRHAKVDVKVLGKGGSDHVALRYRLDG